jgi:hypothetical protein
MPVTGRERAFLPFAKFLGAGACACLVLVGCNRTPSTAERVKQAYESSGLTRVDLYPLAGTVTVDNAPPSIKAKKTAIVAMAYNLSKTDVPVDQNSWVTVQSDGSFAFPDGGLPPGKYVMLFAQLQLHKKRGWHGPDGLKNLYNDPDVNSKKTEFLVDHDKPGKTDYRFNLNLAGETPPPQAAPKALIQLPD